MHCKGACMKPLLDVLMILDALEKEGSFAAASPKLSLNPSGLAGTNRPQDLPVAGGGMKF